MKKLLALMLLLSGCRCQLGCGAGIVQTTPTDAPDAAPAPSGITCADVCAKYRALGCPEGNPTAEGEACEAVCENVQSSGIVKLDLACRAGIASCADIDACGSS
jgi:hypothetical protein